MNCQSCQNNSDAYREGKLPSDLRIQVEKHLQHCEECAENFRLESVAFNLINLEKDLNPGNYLTDKVMARIENLEVTGSQTTSPLIRILKPALLTASMAAAIFAGVLIGNIYKPSVSSLSRPVELALMDDVSIESVYNLSIE